MLGRLNLSKRNGGGGGGGGDLSLNVFAQAAEPSIKNGIWINTSASGSLPLIENFDYDGIEIVNNVFHNAPNNDVIYISNQSIPYDFYNGSAVVIGTDIYMFGSSSSNYRKYAYKYDTRMDTYTRLSDIPYDSYRGSAVAIGTDIYMLGGYDSGNRTSNYIAINTQLTNKYIYLFVDYRKRIARICHNVNLYLNYAAIYQNNTWQQYPAYYGDGTQWNRLPD